jgi:hypothetical protein
VDAPVGSKVRLVGLIAWRELGGLDAQDLLHALETGGTHPLLRKWEELKAGPARNRPPPGASEQAARRLIVLLRVALERTGLSKTAARKHIASALRRQIGTKHFLGFVEFARKPLPAGARWR